MNNDLKNLLQSLGYSIYTFRINDTIIRVEPAITVTKIFNENTMVSIEIEKASTSFMTPMIFKGISNNLIYLQYCTGALKNHVTAVPLSTYCDGWDYFKLPDGLDINNITFV